MADQESKPSSKKRKVNKWNIIIPVECVLIAGLATVSIIGIPQAQEELSNIEAQLNQVQEKAADLESKVAEAEDRNDSLRAEDKELNIKLREIKYPDSTKSSSTSEEDSDDDWAKDYLEEQFGTSDPDRVDDALKVYKQKGDDYYDKYGYYPRG